MRNMVEYEDLNITSVFGEFNSPYCLSNNGNADMVSGNAIYSALIASGYINKQIKKDVVKVSHGIFHNIPYITNNTGDTFVIKTSDEFGYSMKPSSIVKHMGIYKYFIMPRLYDMSLCFRTKKEGGCAANNMTINSGYGKKKIDVTSELGKLDNFRILHPQTIITSDRKNITVIQPQYIHFYIITKNKINIDLNSGDEIRVGSHRNHGFGIINIVDVGHIKLGEIDYSIFNGDEKLIELAKRGICGIYNHRKYGYGEFRIEKWGEDKWLVKTNTPLCLRSTMENSNIFSTLPTFVVPDDYRSRVDNLYIKGNICQLYCVDRGQVFIYE